jgi:hypothetical protein
LLGFKRELQHCCPVRGCLGEDKGSECRLCS